MASEQDLKKHWLGTFDWNPKCRIKSGLPQPWLVWGYDDRALRGVLEVDYMAHRRCSSWVLPEGTLQRVYDDGDLRGYPVGGTLFVLAPPYSSSGRLDRFLVEADYRQYTVVFLAVPREPT